MPTQNRRIATYLPSHVHEAFQAFKTQRDDIKGDSEALVAILSEYLQVSQEVAYPSSSNLLKRIEAIEERLSGIKSELLSELKTDLQQPKIENEKNKLKSELQGELLVSNKPKASQNSSELLDELLIDSSKLQPMSQVDLAVRLQLTNEKSLGNKKSKYRDDPQAFLHWSKSRDIDGVPWEYHEDDKLYHPVQDVYLSQGRGA